MWDRQFEAASWNGVAFNILKTTRDGGKRLQVVEMPYKDDPAIWILGGKAKGYQIDAVFVGEQSLEDANTFEAQLDSDPVGKLEHPYLGELDLVYQDSSFSFSTKKGMVTLSLKFIKQGAAVVIPASSIKSIETYTQTVIEHSTADFVRTVEQATPDQIATLQVEFTSMLGKLRFIANQMQRPGIVLASLNRQISDGLSAISTIANAPGAFADHLNASLSSLVGSVKQSSGSQQSTAATVSSASFANDQLKKVEQSSTTNHIKTLTTMASIETNQSIKTISLDDPWPLDIDFAEADLKGLVSRLSQRMEEATIEATYDRYELVGSLESLNAEMAKHQDQIKGILSSLKETEIYNPTPALNLAHQHECPREKFEGLNPGGHPLFVTGTVKVPNA